MANHIESGRLIRTAAFGESQHGDSTPAPRLFDHAGHKMDQVNRVVKRRMAHNLVAVLVRQFSTWALTSVVFLVIPRHFGPEGAGELGLGLAYSGLLATVTGLGLMTLFTREVARDSREATTWVPTAVLLEGALALVGTVGLGALLLALGSSPGLVLLIVAYCAVTPALHISAAVIASLQGLEQMRQAAAYDVVAKLGMLAVALATVLLNFNLLQFVLLSNAVVIGVACHQLVFIRKHMRWSLAEVSFVRTKGLIRRSVPFFLVAVCFTLYTATDVILLNALAGAAAVGLYTAPSRILGAMLFVPLAVSTVVFPQLSTMHANNDGRFARLCSQALLLAFVSSLGLAIVVFVCGGSLLGMALGAEFEQSQTLLMIFALVLIPTSISTVIGRIGFATDRQNSLWAVGLGGFFAKIVVGFILITVFEARYSQPALGAAFTMLITESAVAVAMIRMYVPREVWDNATLRKLGSSAVAAVGAAVASLGLMSVSVYLAASIGGLAFGFLILALRVYSLQELRAFVPASRFSPGLSR